MTTRFFGAPVKRNEDRKLLTGQALFVDDVELPNMLHAAFLRSQVAHARIRRIDVSAALRWMCSIASPSNAVLEETMKATPRPGCLRR